MSVGDRAHGAHPIRDEERRAVEALLRTPKFRAWARYEDALEPLIHACERKPVRDTPPTLLTKAYEGTPIMAKLNAAARKELPAKDFAGPDRSYPVEDKNHARDALARASEMRNRGELSPKAYGNIVAKAKAKLGKGKKAPAKRDADGDHDGDHEYR